ncbi:MAG: hypothetical protein J7M15_06325 [Anaerolineae bacterium]|nr:hypothetical protein [Anaerolineae bacterium]
MDSSQVADRGSGEIEELEADLREASRHVLITASLVLGLLWLVAVRVRFDAGAQITWLDYLPCFGILGIGIAAWRTSVLRPSWAGPILVLGLLALVLTHYAFSEANSLTPFYLVVVVVAAGIASPRGWSSATVAAGMVLFPCVTPCRPVLYKRSECEALGVGQAQADLRTELDNCPPSRPRRS